jgi:hypothetical protein
MSTDPDPAAVAALADSYRVIAEANLAAQALLREYARQVARERGIVLPEPAPAGTARPRTKPRYRYTRIERPERGVVLATAVNDVTGHVKHLRISKEADGTLDVEETDG